MYQRGAEGSSVGINKPLCVWVLLIKWCRMEKLVSDCLWSSSHVAYLIASAWISAQLLEEGT